MAEVIIANTKWGTELYSSAIGLLQERVDQGFWYDNWDDGNPRHQWSDRAIQVLDENDESLAWDFLCERSDHEYEGVELQDIR